MSDSTEEIGFNVSPNMPGQQQSRINKASLESWLEARRAKPEPTLAVATDEPVAWEEYWRDLMEDRDEQGRLRWDWKKALYIAWHCVPASQRVPRFKRELMDMLGTNEATARKWRQTYPEIDERIAAGPKALLGGHVADVLQALVKVAVMDDPKAHQDRKLFLEMTGQYKPKGAIEMSGGDGEPIEYRNVGELSDEELERIARGGSRGVVAQASSPR